MHTRAHTYTYNTRIHAIGRYVLMYQTFFLHTPLSAIFAISYMYMQHTDIHSRIGDTLYARRIQNIGRC